MSFTIDPPTSGVVTPSTSTRGGSPIDEAQLGDLKSLAAFGQVPLFDPNLFLEDPISLALPPDDAAALTRAQNNMKASVDHGHEDVQLSLDFLDDFDVSSFEKMKPLIDAG